MLHCNLGSMLGSSTHGNYPIKTFYLVDLLGVEFLYYSRTITTRSVFWIYILPLPFDVFFISTCHTRILCNIPTYIPQQQTKHQPKEKVQLTGQVGQSFWAVDHGPDLRSLCCQRHNEPALCSGRGEIPTYLCLYLPWFIVMFFLLSWFILWKANLVYYFLCPSFTPI